jgi:hypothetical protein
MFSYFISYAYKNKEDNDIGAGRFQLDCEKKIQNIGDIERIERRLEHETGLDEVIITNFKRFK